MHIMRVKTNLHEASYYQHLHSPLINMAGIPHADFSSTDSKCFDDRIFARSIKMLMIRYEIAFLKRQLLHCSVRGSFGKSNFTIFSLKIITHPFKEFGVAG